MTFKAVSASLDDLPQIAKISWLTRKQTGIHYSYPHLRMMWVDEKRDLLVVRNERGQVIAYGFLRYDEGDRCFQPGTAAHPELREPGAVAALNRERYRRAQVRGYSKVYGYILTENEASLNYRLNEGWSISGQNDKFTEVEFEIPEVI